MNDNGKILINIPKDGNYIEILGHRIDGFDSFESFCNYIKKYSEMEETINRKKAEIERLRSMNRAKLATIHDLKIELKTAKSEAIKEFGKRLKSRINDSVFNYWNTNTGGYYLAEDVPDEIDNLIDEMVGDNNAE